MVGALPPRPVCPTASAYPAWRLLIYGSLATPLCLAGIPIVLYLPAFYAQELHLKAGVVGTVFLAARVWDATFDLLVGVLSDRSKSRFGRRKPWVLLGAPLLVVTTWYLCDPPRNAGAVYMGVCAALFYTAWTGMYIPYLSWGAELATDYRERSRVTGLREIFTMIGNLVFAGAPLVFLAAGAPLHQVLFLIFLTVLITVPPSTALLAMFVGDPAVARPQKTQLLRELKDLGKDRVLRRFSLAVLFYFAGEGVVNSLVVFFFAVGLDLANKLFWAIFVLYVSTICMVPLTLRIARHVEKHTLLAALLGLQVLIYGLTTFVPQRNFPLVVLLWTMLGLANSAILILPTSILADIIDRDEVQCGERRSGAYVAVYNVVTKVGLALGVGIAFGALAWVGFQPDAVHHTARDVWHIRLLSFGIGCLLEAPAALLYLTHPITRRAHSELRARIEARHRSQVEVFEQTVI